MASRRSERQNLILSFSEITHDDEADLPAEYASTDEAFHDQNLISYAMDEVHAMLQIMCCELKYCTSFYNPLYLFMFILLFIVVLPGAALHWSLLYCLPVRRKEFPEERELRSQGIYASLGIAIVSIPFAGVGLYVGTDEMLVINKVSLAVNAGIIVSSIIALRAIGDELINTIRVFAVGSWVVDLFLIGLALLDAYSYLTLSWISVVEYALRIFEIFIYTVIAVQCIQLWNIYETPKQYFTRDIIFSVLLGVIYAGIVVGFVAAILISEENAWRILYF